jgi:hypothetical protein
VTDSASEIAQRSRAGRFSSGGVGFVRGSKPSRAAYSAKKFVTFRILCKKRRFAFLTPSSVNLTPWPGVIFE